MRVKKANAHSVRVGALVVPACDIDLSQENNGEWLAHFAASAVLTEEQVAREDLSCGWNALTASWHVTVVADREPTVERELSDEGLEALFTEVASRGRLVGAHSEIWERALVGV